MAARNATLQWNLLSIPAKLEKAVEAKASNVNMCVGKQPETAPNTGVTAEHDAKPVKAPKTCEDCGPITDNDALVKGVKQGSTYAIVKQDEITEAKDKFTKEYKGVVNLVAHPAADFLANTGPGESINYVTPADDKDPRFRALMQAVENHPELAFVALYTPVSATSLYLLRMHNGALVLEQRSRTQELKAAPVLGDEVGLYNGRYTQGDLLNLIESDLAPGPVPYDPEAYEDKYAAALITLAENADTVVAAGNAAKVPSKASVDVDLIAKLQALAAS